MQTNLAVRSLLNKKIRILGNLNIDLIIRNIAEMPAWGQEVLGSDYQVFSSGQATYTASALAGLKMKPELVGCVGDDGYGSQILNDLENRHVDVSGVQRIRDGKTGITVAVVRPDGERAFISDTASLSAFDRTMAASGLDTGTGSSLTCFLGTFFLPGLSLQDLRFLIRQSRGTGGSTLLDTGWDSGGWPVSTVRELRDLLEDVDYFIPNLDEARALTGESAPEKAAEMLLSDGCGTVVIKLGSEGSYLRTGSAEIHSPALPAVVFDAVGAGDVYNAGFIFGTLQDWPPEACMAFGTSLASLYIARRTDRFPDFATAADFMNRNTKFTVEGSHDY